MIFSSSPARVAILGPGGVGKTAIALAVLTHEKVVSRFSDSRYLVPCNSLMSRDALLAAIAISLSVLRNGTIDGYSQRLESDVLSALESEECILCLDSFESPWDQPSPSRRAVEALLADITAKSCVTVLITMRGVERPKETAWTLPMLPPLTNFSRDAAKYTWESLAGTCDEWAEKLIDAIDYLPLAVTLLGSLAEVSTAETLWERWQKEDIALIEKEKGDKLESLEFSISRSFNCNRMAADGFSKRLLGILSLLPDGMPASASPEFRRLFPDIPDISRSLDTLVKCSLATRTADRRIQVNSLIRHYCERNDVIVPEDRQALASHGYDYADHEASEVTLSLFNPDQHSQYSIPPSLSRTSPTSPPAASSGRPRSFGIDPSPVRGADDATQPTVSITPAGLQSTTEVSSYWSAPYFRGSTSPAINALSPFPFASHVPSRSPSPARFPEHGSGLESDTDNIITRAERYIQTRSVRSFSPLLVPTDVHGSVARDRGHQWFRRYGGKYRLRGSLYRCRPLAICARAWVTTRWQYSSQYLGCRREGQGERHEHPIRLAGLDYRSLQANHVASLRLTGRCEDILISIRDEIAHTGNTVIEELHEPTGKLVKCVSAVLIDPHTFHLIFH